MFELFLDLLHRGDSVLHSLSPASKLCLGKRLIRNIVHALTAAVRPECQLEADVRLCTIEIVKLEVPVHPCVTKKATITIKHKPENSDAAIARRTMPLRQRKKHTSNLANPIDGFWSHPSAAFVLADLESNEAQHNRLGGHNHEQMGE